MVDDLPQLALTEEIRIGSVDDPDLGFTNISAVSTGNDGLLYVLERAEREVRVYDNGALVRRFGRGGSGPGEFQMPIGMGLLGDTVWVMDWGNQRISLFNRNGSYINAYSTPSIMLEPRPGINIMLRAAGLAPDGTLTGSWAIMIPEDPPTDTIRIPVVRMDTTGAVIDTIRYQRWAFPQSNRAEVGGRSLPVPAAPATDEIVTDAPGGGLFTVERPLATTAASGEFTVTRATAAGDTLYSRSFHYRPHPWSAAAIDSLIASRDGTLESMAVDIQAGREAMRKAISLPDFQPGIRSATAGSDGSLWLRSENAASADVRWLLLNPEGVPRGVITTSRSATLREADGTGAWFVEPDELDVPWLVRYRIEDAM